MKVWYVALAGRPNSWKSSFLNALIGEKVGIVSNTPQTTRKSIRWIYTDEHCQIVFFDTPGIHESREDFNIKINAVAERAIKDADAVVRFVDSSRPFWEEEKAIDALVVKSKKPVVRVLSKWDAALPGMDKGKGLSCSSVKNYGLLEVVKALLEFLPEGVPYYDEDYYTDQDPYTRISEIIREKAFRNLSQEIPHDLYVSVEEIDEQGDLMRILSYLIVEKDSQKRIVIGKGAEKIQEIATLARVELEQIFGRKVFLSLRVKVDPKWKNNNKIVSHLLS